MKYITTFFRVFVGLLFIFSGLIKSNDPTGFSYKLDEYLSVFAEELKPTQDSIAIQINYGSESETRFIGLEQNTKTIDINVNKSKWEADSPIAGSLDSSYTSKVMVSLYTAELWTAPLHRLAADTTCKMLTVSAYLNGKKLKSHTIALTPQNDSPTILHIATTDYVKPQSGLVNFFQKMRLYTLAIAIFLCVLEIVLGIALLIGWAPRLIITFLAVLILFFTFLTWYSAYYNKVTDCGCFGDAIKLTPWESFYKDILLSISIFFIALGIPHIKPVFSRPFAVKLLTVFTLISIGFSVYCWHYLPVKNFLQFKKGNDIQALAIVPAGAPVDVYENVFVYAKDGKEQAFTLAEMSGRDLKKEGYSFIDRRDKLLVKGYEPAIHDFKLMDESRENDYVSDFFGNDTAYKLLIVVNEVAKTNEEAIKELHDILITCRQEGVEVFPITASSSKEVEDFRQKHDLQIPFYYGDKTNLKSIIRSNPGLVLLKGNIVRKNWPSTRLPTVNQFKKKIAK